MKLQQLRFLVAAIESGGIVKGAIRMHVSQPAVSAGLKALEREIGVPLFEHSGRGGRARPTSKALQLHQSALGILKQCDLALAQLRHPEHRPTSLRLGVLPTIATRDLCAIASSFSGEERPRLQLWEGGAVRLAEWLRQGRIDAALTVVEKTTSTAKVLWRERFVVVASRTHRFGSKRLSKLFLSDLEGETVILRTACEMRPGALWPDTQRIRVAARAERDELAMRLVAMGVGIAIVPVSLVTSDVTARPIHDLDVRRAIGLRWRRDAPPEQLRPLIDRISALRSRRHDSRCHAR
jgi:DNA-binding transcriptional LysR family regulator